MLIVIRDNPAGASMAGEALPHPLLDAILALNSELDLPHVFDRFLTAATEYTGAHYAAINIVDDEGVSVDFHYTGMPDRNVGADQVARQITLQPWRAFQPKGTIVIDGIDRAPFVRRLPRRPPAHGRVPGHGAHRS